MPPSWGHEPGVRWWQQDKPRRCLGPRLMAHRHTRPAEVGKASSANGHAATTLATQTQESKAERGRTRSRTAPGRPGSGCSSTHA